MARHAAGPLRGGLSPPGRFPVALLLVATSMALLVSGCELDVVFGISVDRQGGGTVEVLIGVDRELVGDAAAAGVDPLGELETVGAGLREAGWRVTVTERADGGREVALAGRFENPDALATMTRELADAIAGPELRPLEPFAVDVTEDRIVVRGAAALQPAAAVQELGLDVPGAVELLSEAVDYRVQVTLPGEVIESTADEHDGAVLTWHVPAGQQVSVVAVGERPRSPVLLLVLGAIGGVLFAWFVVGSGRRRPRSRPRRGWHRRSRSSDRVSLDVAARYRGRG